MNTNNTDILDVVILTDSRFIDQNHQDSFYQNVYLEDGLLKKSLEKEGLKTQIVAWDDSDFDWKTTRYAIFRSTWDYFDRFNEFSKWLQQVGKQTQLLNSANIIHWNIDKHYLKELQNSGIHTIATHYIEKGTSITLGEILEQNHWNEAIVKPCISAGAFRTFRVNQDNCTTLNAQFQAYTKEQAMMVQPFQNQIVDKGEVSLVVINGTFTHAVLKQAKPGDFRVQDDFGGTVQPYKPSVEEIEFAEKAIAACPEQPAYARVDLIHDNDGKIALIELELIEPELWFRFNPKAAELLAQHIKYK